MVDNVCATIVDCLGVMCIVGSTPGYCVVVVFIVGTTLVFCLGVVVTFGANFGNKYSSSVVAILNISASLLVMINLFLTNVGNGVAEVDFCRIWTSFAIFLPLLLMIERTLLCVVIGIT